MLTSIKLFLQGKEIFSKGLLSLALKIFGSFFGYIFLWLVTNSLGASAWGEYVIFLAILNISSIFSRLGVDKLALKLVAANNSNMAEVRKIYFSSLKLILMISIITSLLIFVISHVISTYIIDLNSFLSPIQMVVVILPFFSVICLNENTLRGLKMIKDFAFFQRTAKMLFSVGFFLLLFYGLQLSVPTLVVYSYLLALFLIFFLSSFRVLNVMKVKFIEKGNSLKYKDIIKQSMPMMISSSVLLLMTWSDSLMIGSFSGKHEVGVYNVAVKVALFTTLTLSAVNSIVAPKLSESFNNNRNSEFKDIIRYSTRLIFFSTIPILLLIFLFPEFILSLFGAEFVIAKLALIILTVSQAVNALSGSVGTILNMTGKQKVYGSILLISLILNIVLNYILIPSYGINGAAVASACSLIFWNLYSVYYIYKQYNVLTIVSFKIK